MSFATPLAFLFFLPWLFAAWRLFRASRRRQGIPFAVLSRIPHRTSFRQRLRFLSPLLLLLGLAALIVAAARPQTKLQRISSQSDAVAISMVFDVSYSMMNPDMASSKGPSERTRLEAAKEAFTEFVKRRPSDLIGLVTFGAYATTRAPLTLDHEALLHLLSDIQIKENEEAASTAIGDGLAMGCARLEQATNVVSHIAVLLTDGQNNAGEVAPLAAAAAAKTLGVRVYTIGIGDLETVRSPFGMALGQRDGVDAKTLTAIAKATGGQFFRARDAKALDRAMEEIDSLEKSAINEIRYENRSEHYLPWLASGGLLLALSFFFGLFLNHRIA